MADDTDYQSVLDMYAQSGMRNPQISYDANGKPIVVAGDAGLPVDVSTLQDYASTLPADNINNNPLPTHYPYTPPPTQKAYDVLTGSNGQERYRLFPERIVRSALSLPTDVMSGKVATPMQQPAGGSEEDYSSDPLLQRVQDMAALMGGGGVASAEKGALGTAGGKLVQPAVEAAPAEIAPVFHSAVENAVNTSTLKAANPDQWLGTIKNAKGVKPEELDWTGLKDWLGEQSGPVSKEQVQGYLQQNKVGLGEVNKGAPSLQDKIDYLQSQGYDYEDATELAMKDFGGKDQTKYSKYQLPGGENYREKLLTLPTSKQTSFNPLLVNYRKLNDYKDNTSYRLSYGDKEIGTFTDYKDNPRTPEEWQDVVKRRFAGDPTLGIKPLDTENYRSSHWDEPNILAHIRMNDRNVEGAKALHIEEIQSDWHQQGREQGYKITESQKQQLEGIENKLTTGLSEGDIGNPDMDAVLKTAVSKKVITQEEAKNYKDWSKGENSTIPDAPFKKTWLDLALKRVIREAAESGKDRISWTPGEAQAARYDLSKHIKEISHIKNQNGTYDIAASDHKGSDIPINNRGNMTERDLENTFGKEIAKKIVNNEGSSYRGRSFKTLEGLDLKVGGEGMHYFYDKMLPAALEKLTGQKMKVGSILKEKGLPESTGNTAMKWPATPDKMQPINYIDLPQFVKDTALHRGFPLFSSGFMLNPIQGDPFKKSKFKLVPVTSEPKFK